MNRARSIALVVSIACAAFSIGGAFFDPAQFFQSYLFGFLYWTGLSLGCFGLVMLHHLVGGRWGQVTRRFFEAGLTALPFMAVLFVPLLFALPTLYGWARPAEVAGDPVLQHRHAYLNVPFFIVRMAGYFVLWIWLARALGRGSHEQDVTEDPAPTRRLRALSGPGLVIYVLSVTFAFIDLVLSLEPDWYSTIFPMMLVIGQTLAALALGVFMLALLAGDEPFRGVVTPTHFHHLGNLMLAFVMLWAYMSFSQLLIIYSGNLPDEISWYLHRDTPGWKTLALLLGLFHFAVPFALLLSRQWKHQVRFLGGLAAVILVAHGADVYWLVMPSFHRELHLHWLDFTVPLGMGGLWIGWFLTRLQAHPLIPRNDPRLLPAHPST